MLSSPLWSFRRLEGGHHFIEGTLHLLLFCPRLSMLATSELIRCRVGRRASLIEGLSRELIEAWDISLTLLKPFLKSLDSISDLSLSVREPWFSPASSPLHPASLTALTALAALTALRTSSSALSYALRLTTCTLR